MPGRRRPALSDDLFDLVADGLERDAEALEGLGGDAFTFVDETQEDVLGADVAVVQQPRFLLRQHDDSPGPVGEAFEHVCRPFPNGDCVYSLYRWAVGLLDRSCAIDRVTVASAGRVSARMSRGVFAGSAESA